MAKPQKAMLFFNPKSGNSEARHHCQLIYQHFADHQIDLESILVPKAHETLSAIIDQAITDGVDLFMAAGGDGTISMISTHLVGKDIPLGIIPLGTGNLLSKTLGIPQKIEHALDLITSSDHTLVNIDTIKLGDRFGLINVSVGVTPKVMEAVDSSQKQLLGNFAYLINFIQQILGLKLQRVSIDCDHQRSSVLASEILITNIGMPGIEPLTLSEKIQMDDGIMDLIIFRAANISDIFGLVISIFVNKGKYNPSVKLMKVREYCRIESKSPMQTQADGDVVGETPIEIEIFPNSLLLIAGKKEHEKHEKGIQHEDL